MRWLWIVVAAGCQFRPGTIVETVDAPVDGPVIDVPIEPKCPAAPPACKLFTCPGSASCYYVCGNTSNSKFSWPTAVTGCTNLNLGCIVTINDQAEQNCIAAQAMPTFASFVWIGYHQSPTGEEPAGDWSWQCGTSNLIPSWGQLEPNNIVDEDCAAMTNGGNWVDGACGSTGRTVCELP